MTRTSKISAVVDTNVFVSCLSRKSVNHIVYAGLIADYYDLHITNEILLEYEEKISSKYDAGTA